MVKKIQVVGGNLYRIAAEQLGDATQWVRIAEATRGLKDPFLVGPFTLTIPDADASKTGGLPTLPILRPTTAPETPFLIPFGISGLTPGSPGTATPPPPPVPVPTPGPTPVPPPTPVPTPGPTPIPTPTPTPVPTPTPTPTPVLIPLTYLLVDNGVVLMTIIVQPGEDIESTNITWPIGALDGVLLDEISNYLVDEAGNFLDATTELENEPDNTDVCIDDDGDFLIDENGNFLDDSDGQDDTTYLVDEVANQLVDEAGNYLIDGVDTVVLPDFAVDEAGNSLVDEQANFLTA